MLILPVWRHHGSCSEGVSIQELFCEHFYKLGVTAVRLADAGLGVGSSGEWDSGGLSSN